MTDAPRILVVGRAGQLATDLAAACERASRTARFLGRPDLDLADAGSIERALNAVRPDAVINAAAYTAVDKAESERDLAFAVNATGPGHLAAVCARARVPLVHVSTDMVFPDRDDRAHREGDPVAPLSHYGVTKLEGERRVLDTSGGHLVVRVSWVFGPSGENFVTKLLDWARNRPELSIVGDQRGRPTYSPALAAALLDLADGMVAGGLAAPCGILHLAGADVMTRDEQARRVMGASRARGGPHAAINPVPTSAFPTPARRALNAVLDVELARARYGIELGSFDRDLDETLDKIVGPVVAASY